MQKPIVHLIYGFLGSGKTTFAKKLAAETNAIRFSLDDWTIKDHGAVPPAEGFNELVAQTNKKLMAAATDALIKGNDIILDHGFWSRKSRDEIRQWAQKHHAVSKLYFLSCAEDIARARVRYRTETMPEGALFISDKSFTELKERFEPLGADEEHILITTN